MLDFTYIETMNAPKQRIPTDTCETGPKTSLVERVIANDATSVVKTS